MEEEEALAPLQSPAQPQTPRERLGEPPPLYHSAAGEQELRAHYDRTLAALPFPHEERFVETPSFGRVHVVVAGPPAGPPLVLWHGTATPAPFALGAFAPLVDHFRVYAPDLPCQGGYPAGYLAGHLAGYLAGYLGVRAACQLMGLFCDGAGMQATARVPEGAP